MANKLSYYQANNHLVVRDKKTALDVFQRYDITGEIIELDLLEQDAIDRLLEGVRPAIVFNLIGYGIDRSERDEKCAYQINAELVGKLCTAVAKYRDTSWSRQNLVHVGSALEYGAIGGDLSEELIPNPTTTYGKSKLMGTQLISEYGDKLKLKAITARLFTVYGPGEHPGRLLPSLVSQASSGDELKLTAGNQQRDFTYVEDVVEGLIRLGTVDNIPWSVLNLATGELHSVREFIKIAAVVLNIANDKLVFGALPTRNEEMEHDPVNIGRLRSILKWSPETNIHDGILKTMLFEKRM